MLHGCDVVVIFMMNFTIRFYVLPGMMISSSLVRAINMKENDIASHYHLATHFYDRNYDILFPWTKIDMVKNIIDCCRHLAPSVAHQGVEMVAVLTTVHPSAAWLRRSSTSRLFVG